MPGDHWEIGPSNALLDAAVDALCADASVAVTLAVIVVQHGRIIAERFRRIAETADAIVIDEAHHFRNPGQRGAGADHSKDSRYYRLFDILDPISHPKSVFMLTATPINNRLSDFRHIML